MEKRITLKTEKAFDRNIFAGGKQKKVCTIKYKHLKTGKLLNDKKKQKEKYEKIEREGCKTRKTFELWKPENI